MRFLWIGAVALLIITNASAVNKAFMTLSADSKPTPGAKTEVSAPPAQGTKVNE
jgi:hypothetical protein